MYMTEHMYVCMAKHMYECMAEHCVSFYELLLQYLVEANSSLVQSIREIVWYNPFAWVQVFLCLACLC